MFVETLETREKPEPKNLGSSWAGFHLIKFPVSQFITEKTRKFWVGSGFGYFQIFAHSNHYYAIFNDHYAIFSVNNTIAFFTFSIIQEDQRAG